MKLLAGLFILALVCAIGIGVMIWGWGVRPQSWGVILGGYVVSTMLMIISAAIRE